MTLTDRIKQAESELSVAKAALELMLSKPNFNVYDLLLIRNKITDIKSDLILLRQKQRQSA